MGDIQQKHQCTEITFEKKEPSQPSEPVTINTFKPPNKLEPNITKKKKSRCFECKKRIGLLPITCKCGVQTCIRHKWPDHHCTYDYRSADLERLAKENPPVVADKLNRI